MMNITKAIKTLDRSGKAIGISVFALILGACSSQETPHYQSHIENGLIILGSEPVMDGVDQNPPLKTVNVVQAPNRVGPVAVEVGYFESVFGGNTDASDTAGEGNTAESNTAGGWTSGDQAVDQPSNQSPHQSKGNSDLNGSGPWAATSESDKQPLKGSAKPPVRAKFVDNDPLILTNPELQSRVLRYYKSIGQMEQSTLNTFKKASTSGDPLVLCRLGDLYLKGINGPADPAIAAAYYGRAARKESAYGQYMLSIFYKQGIATPVNIDRASYWYDRASHTPGNDFARLAVAQHFQSSSDILYDPQQARAWVQSAALAGNVAALNASRQWFQDGDNSNSQQVLFDTLNTYGKAAAKGSAEAQYQLGLLFLTGNQLVQNTQEAVQWFRYAGAQGHSRAQYELGRMYREGQGVPKNLPEAYAWWSLAQKGGVAVDLKGLIREMSYAELGTANAILHEYQLKFNLS
jgi:TPR repeat protein